MSTVESTGADVGKNSTLHKATGGVLNIGYTFANEIGLTGVTAEGYKINFFWKEEVK